MPNVGVILDWARAARGNAWKPLLQEIDPSLKVSFYPIADLIVAPEEEGKGLQVINREDVLIINWDCANGDPEFGAHLCQRWLGHRRPEIIEWVRKGGILVIESQATLGVPCAAAYEAAVGPGELPTSGIDDPTHPLQSVAPRSGTAARKTSRFPAGFGFGAVPDRILTGRAYPEVDPFPRSTTGLLRDVLEKTGREPLLWRGVFRRTLPFTRRFQWISILETDSGPFYRQSVMQVARVGDGAIFASTMMLAMTRQIEIARAIIRCAGGNTSHLPTSIAPVQRVKTAVKWFLAIFGGILAALVGKFAGAERLQSVLPGVVSNSAFQGWIQLLLLALGLAAGVWGYHLYRRLRKLIRNIVGS